MMTDKELEQIYNEAYKAVYWTAMGLLKNESDAEDIVQDTFVALIESYDSIKDKNKVLPWLKKTAANKCLNRLKLAKTDIMDEEFFESVEAVPEDFLPDSIIESEEARKIVMDIINNKLSDDIRRTLILFYFDDMSTKEISEALGIPQGTVSWRLNFAKKTIKKEVEKYEKDNDTKLYGMAIPFLSKLFMKEAEQVVLKPMPASFANLSASAEASKAGTNIAKTAVKKGTDIMKTKILIGSIAAVVAVGVVTGIIISTMNKKPDTASHTKTGIEDEEVTTTEDSAAVSTTEFSVTESDNITETTDADVAVSDGDGVYLFAGVDDLAAIYNLGSGVTLENYADRFAAAPSKVENKGLRFKFNEGAAGTDYISQVELRNIDQADDGTIILKPNSTVTIDIFIADYDHATALYEELYDDLCSVEGKGSIDPDNSGNYDDRTDNVWSANIIYQRIEVSEDDPHNAGGITDGVTHYYYSPTYTLSMIKDGDSYKIKIMYPLV